jgi:hypothetical protein
MSAPVTASAEFVERDASQARLGTQAGPVVGVGGGGEQRGGQAVDRGVHSGGEQRANQQWSLLGRDVASVCGGPYSGAETVSGQRLSRALLVYPT